MSSVTSYSCKKKSKYKNTERGNLTNYSNKYSQRYHTPAQRYKSHNNIDKLNSQSPDISFNEREFIASTNYRCNTKTRPLLEQETSFNSSMYLFQSQNQKLKKKNVITKGDNHHNAKDWKEKSVKKKVHKKKSIPTEMSFTIDAISAEDLPSINTDGADKSLYVCKSNLIFPGTTQSSSNKNERTKSTSFKKSSCSSISSYQLKGKRESKIQELDEKYNEHLNKENSITNQSSLDGSKESKNIYLKRNLSDDEASLSSHKDSKDFTASDTFLEGNTVKIPENNNLNVSSNLPPIGVTQPEMSTYVSSLLECGQTTSKAKEYSPVKESKENLQFFSQISQTISLPPFVKPAIEPYQPHLSSLHEITGGNWEQPNQVENENGSSQISSNGFMDSKIIPFPSLNETFSLTLGQKDQTPLVPIKEESGGFSLEESHDKVKNKTLTVFDLSASCNLIGSMESSFFSTKKPVASLDNPPFPPTPHEMSIFHSPLSKKHEDSPLISDKASDDESLFENEIIPSSQDNEIPFNFNCPNMESLKDLSNKLTRNSSIESIVSNSVSSETSENMNSVGCIEKLPFLSEEFQQVQEKECTKKKQYVTSTQYSQVFHTLPVPPFSPLRTESSIPTPCYSKELNEFPSTNKLTDDAKNSSKTIDYPVSNCNLTDPISCKEMSHEVDTKTTDNPLSTCNPTDPISCKEKSLELSTSPGMSSVQMKLKTDIENDYINNVNDIVSNVRNLLLRKKKFYIDNDLSTKFVIKIKESVDDERASSETYRFPLLSTNGLKSNTNSISVTMETSLQEAPNVKKVKKMSKENPSPSWKTKKNSSSKKKVKIAETPKKVLKKESIPVKFNDSARVNCYIPEETFLKENWWDVYLEDIPKSIFQNSSDSYTKEKEKTKKEKVGKSTFPISNLSGKVEENILEKEDNKKVNYRDEEVEILSVHSSLTEKAKVSSKKRKKEKSNVDKSDLKYSEASYEKALECTPILEPSKAKKKKKKSNSNNEMEECPKKFKRDKSVATDEKITAKKKNKNKELKVSLERIPDSLIEKHKAKSSDYLNTNTTVSELPQHVPTKRCLVEIKKTRKHSLRSNPSPFNEFRISKKKLLPPFSLKKIPVQSGKRRVLYNKMDSDYLDESLPVINFLG